MKAICITNRNHDTPEKNGRNAILTIGKVYDVRCYALDYYAVVSDAGRDIGVPNYYFKLIDEYRQETIDQLLSEPSFFQVTPMTFNPKKSIIERYGSKERIREIKLDEILK